MINTDPDAPRPISSDWLTLRRPADEAARQASLPLLAELQAFLTAEEVPDGDEQPVRIFDLGAGTGANQAWLAPQLNATQPQLKQQWTLIDHDPALLEHTMSEPSIDGVIGTEAVVAGIEDLEQILRGDTEAAGHLRFVTCSALLDLLTTTQLDTLCAALAESHTAALFSLSVTGTMTIEPADPLDDSLNKAFNLHQNRGGRAGARGVDLTQQFLADAGFTVTTVDTPWELRGKHTALIERFLSDRADAVLEEEPSLAEDLNQWLARRAEQAAAGSLRLTIGHRDLLALPPRQ